MIGADFLVRRARGPFGDFPRQLPPAACLEAGKLGALLPPKRHLPALARATFSALWVRIDGWHSCSLQICAGTARAAAGGRHGVQTDSPEWSDAAAARRGRHAGQHAGGASAGHTDLCRPLPVRRQGQERQEGQAGPEQDLEGSADHRAQRRRSHPACVQPPGLWPAPWRHRARPPDGPGKVGRAAAQPRFHQRLGPAVAPRAFSDADDVGLEATGRISPADAGRQEGRAKPGGVPETARATGQAAGRTPEDAGSSAASDQPAANPGDNSKPARLGAKRQGFGGGDTNNPPMRLEDSRAPQRIVAELAMAKMTRAIYSERQLYEEMVDFWFTHSTFYAARAPNKGLLPPYEGDVTPPHAMGKLRALLFATAKTP